MVVVVAAVLGNAHQVTSILLGDTVVPNIE